jgi:hypothetical protein
MKPPLTKVEMIEFSMSCFRWGLFGLLPLIGIPMAVRALLLYHRVKSSQAGVWNPARRYLRWGGICARMGLWVFLVIPLGLATCEALFKFP